MLTGSSSRPVKTTGLILIILILLIIFWPTDLSQLDSHSPPPKGSSQPEIVVQKTQTGNTGSTRVIRTRSKDKPSDGEIDPYQDWELSKILSHFMVPPGEFRAGSINDSITKLKAIYREHSGHELEIALQAPVHPDTVISFHHDNISFRTLLGMVAGLSAYSVSVNSNEVLFTDITPPRPRTAIELSSPNALSDEAYDEILNNPAETLEYLKSLGFHSPEVYGFPDDPKNLSNLIHLLQDARLDPENQPRQVSIHNSLVSFPPGYEFESTDLSGAELQQLLRDWRQTKGVEIKATPSLVAQPGQDATIEMGHEFIFPNGNEEFQTDFIGLRMVANPVLAGLDRIQVGGEITMSSLDEKRFPELLGDAIDKSTTETEIQLNDGRSVLIPIIGENGNTTVQVITSQRLDASGEPFWPPKSDQ